LLTLLRHIKRYAFRVISRLYMTRRVRSILHYLQSVQVKEGFGKEGLERVLVLAPHPDDEAIGCGGTIRALTSAGVRCDVLFMTVGEKSYMPQSPTPISFAKAARAKKGMAYEACNILGVSEVFYLGGSDGELHEQLWRWEQLVEIVNRNVYQRIFCPWAHDTHSDHAATFRILEKAAPHFNQEASFWFYEVWSPLVANQVVGVDQTIDAKMRAIAVYEESCEDVDYVSHFLGLSRYRSLLLKSSKYAEAFLVATPSQFAGISRGSGVSEGIFPRAPHVS
jgi:N-acetylglucosamine malate deacetylase 1